MQKSTKLLAGAVIVLLGVVVFQSIRIQRLSAQASRPSASSEKPSRPTAIEAPEQKRQVAELETATREILRLRREVADNRPRASGIAGRVAELKEVLQQLPEQQIPLLPYATEADWYAAVDGSLETEDDFRLALARLRASAEGRFAKLLQPALRAYMAANGGNFPTDVVQLQSFFAESVSPAALQHYRIVRARDIRSVRVGGDWAITQVAVIDPELDAHVVIGPRGQGSYGGPPK